MNFHKQQEILSTPLASRNPQIESALTQLARNAQPSSIDGEYEINPEAVGNPVDRLNMVLRFFKLHPDVTTLRVVVNNHFFRYVIDRNSPERSTVEFLAGKGEREPFFHIDVEEIRAWHEREIRQRLAEVR